MRGRRTAWLIAIVLAIVLAASAIGTASAEELRGTVQLVARGGAGPARGSDVRQAVVYFEPAGRPAPRPPAEPFLMSAKQKEFVPHILAVPRGSRVRFPNDDPILHNVFSVSGGNSFDLGLSKKGPGKEQTFNEAGLVRIFCNVHQAMVAYVLVLDTPYSTAPAADGKFVLSGLPKGPGKLTVWHEQAEPLTMSVQVPQGGGAAGAPLTARLEVVRPQLPPHLNKLGKSYFLSGRDRYR